MGLGPARVGIGGAARESVFCSSARAASRIEVSRPETGTPSREESSRGNQRIQNEAPAENTGDKNLLRDGKNIAARRNRAKTRAPAREVNCASPAMSSFARSWRKLVETGSREFNKRLRGDAVSFLITAALGSADLVQNPVRKGRPVQGARNKEMMRATITGA